MQYILHIGFGKAGSTSLQSALRDNRETLRRHGVVYPRTGVFGPFGAKRKNLCAVLSGVAPGQVGMPDDWVDRFHAETVGADICILSWEGFMGPLQVEAAASFFPRSRTQVVIYVREPVAYVASVYKHSVIKKNTTMCFRDFAENFHLRYFDVAERWAAAFGRENIVIRCSDREGGRRDIVSDFADLIGLNLNDAFPSHEYELNPGISGNLLFLKRVLNCYITFEENRTIKKREMRDLIKLDHTFRSNMPVDQETVDLIGHRSRKVLEGLENHFGLSIRPRENPVDSFPCPDFSRLGQDFERILVATRERNNCLAPLLERMAGMFAKT